MNYERQATLVSAFLVLVATAAVAASACSSSTSTTLPAGVPAGATAFDVPATGWSAGATCTGNEYLVYAEPSCTDTLYVICESDEWAYSVCSTTPPSGYMEYASESDDGGTAPDASGYPNCGAACSACTDLESCCGSVGDLPSAGVCDHTGWNESVCESLLNTYSAQCGEHCADGTCDNTASDAGASDAGEEDASSGSDDSDADTSSADASDAG